MKTYSEIAAMTREDLIDLVMKMAAEIEKLKTEIARRKKYLANLK